MRKIKYLAFNGKELVPVISLDSMKDGDPIVLVSEDGSGDLPLVNLGKVAVYEFTGRLDKDGNEIYEEHIVIAPVEEFNGRFLDVVGHEQYVIRWSDYDAAFIGVSKNVHGLGDLALTDLANCEIQGHITTHPELVK